MKKGVDYIGVTICFFCHDGKGNLLLQKRNKNCRDEQNTWDVGGGSVEFGETFEEAVRRELQEELCVTPIQLQYAGTNNVLRKNNGVQTHWVAIVYGALIDPTQPKIGDTYRIDELKWFPKDKLPSPLHSMLLPHMELIKKAKIL